MSEIRNIANNLRDQVVHMLAQAQKRPPARGEIENMKFGSICSRLLQAVGQTLICPTGQNPSP
jgi:hypothetical protein